MPSLHGPPLPRGIRAAKRQAMRANQAQIDAGQYGNSQRPSGGRVLLPIKIRGGQNDHSRSSRGSSNIQHSID